MQFTLEKWNEKYIDDVAKYANNQKVARYLRDVFPYPYTKNDAKQYVTMCANSDEVADLCRAIVVDGHAVGSVGIFVQTVVLRKSAELGYWLGEDFWGMGIMSSAVGLICKEAFNKFDIVRIFAQPFAVNIGSCRVLEKNGFVLEGVTKNGVYKNGQLIDDCMYALLK